MSYEQTLVQPRYDQQLGGPRGASLYETWLAAGNVGTIFDFFNAMIAGSGITVVGAAGQSVATRALLAAIVGPVNNQTAYLAEPGRQGWFKFSTANLSASVTADPNQGLYVAPAAGPTGAAGAWVREVAGQDHQASWWGVSTGVANNTPLLASAIALLPTGGKLHLDGGVFPQTTSLAATRGDFSLIGKGYNTTILRMAVASGPIGNLGVTASNVTLHEIGFETNSDHLFANNNPNVGFGAPNGAAAPLYQNWRVTNCRFYGAGIGLICSGSDDNNATITLAKDIYVAGCVFQNDEMGVSFAACQDVEVHDCRFEMIVAAQNGAGCCVRTWGSKNVKVVDCHGSANSEFGILISTFERTTATGHIRLVNDGYQIFENLNFTNCKSEGVHVSECKGDLIFRGCTFVGDTFASTALSYGIRFAGGFAAVTGVVPVCDKVKVENCTFKGYAVGIDENMAMRALRVKASNFIGNSDADAYPAGAMCGRFAGGIVLTEILDSDFLMASQAAGARFRIATGNAAQRFRLVRNTLPEGGGINVHDAAGGGVQIQDSGNLDYQAGTFAAHIA